LILGALAGLGFAFMENFFDAIIYTSAVERAIIPPLGHICYSAIAAIGIAVTSKKSIYIINRLKINTCRNQHKRSKDFLLSRCHFIL
jgi:RsiW-degrading membrane proteinase PrsW (M82 family)